MFILFVALLAPFFSSFANIIECKLSNNIFKHPATMIFYISLMNCLFMPLLLFFGIPTLPAPGAVPFYFLLAFSHCIAAVLRGSGHASVPMVVMLCVWCLFRVSYITVTVRLIPDIRVIFWAYPLTWSISSVIFLYLFLKGKWVYGFEKGGKQG